jgi:hypothetical protein
MPSKRTTHNARSISITPHLLSKRTDRNRITRSVHRLLKHGRHHMATREECRARFRALRAAMRKLSLEDVMARATEDELTAVYALLHHDEAGDRDVPYQRRMADTLALVRTTRELVASAERGWGWPLPETEARGHEEEAGERGHEDEGGEEGGQEVDSHEEIYRTDAAQDALAIISGGVSLKDVIRRRPSADHLCAPDTLPALMQHMPFKILRRPDIACLGVFSDNTILDAIPDDWRTTVLGLVRAMKENDSLGRGAGDRSLLDRLALRGGLVLKVGEVAYPEDIVSVYGQVYGGQGADEYDRTYWEEVLLQGVDMGAVWEFVFPEQYPVVLGVEAEEGGEEHGAGE